MKKVLVRQEKVTIPTYPISAYDKNPMFLESASIRAPAGGSIRTPYARAFPILKLTGNTMPSIWKTTICL